MEHRQAAAETLFKYHRKLYRVGGNIDARFFTSRWWAGPAAQVLSSPAETNEVTPRG